MNDFYARDFYNARTQLVAATNTDRIGDHR